MIMKNCRAFRSHHDLEVMIAWINGFTRGVPRAAGRGRGTVSGDGA
jgi:hypothetical protein